MVAFRCAKEIGSDFHFCTNIYSDIDFFQKREKSCYANGRHPIIHLIEINKWKRIWLPSYFCYDVISSIQDTGIGISIYNDSPSKDDINVISQIKFSVGDVILRMNYFGLRRWRTNEDIPVPVIEDHSHDLLGEWVTKSNADWAIASLRKTLPIPEGGILWSPLGLSLPKIPVTTIDNELLSYKRLSAMFLKKLYISGDIFSKDEFRDLYIETEKSLGTLPVCEISECSRFLLNKININEWYKNKIANWKVLSNMVEGYIEYLQPENLAYNNPFSFMLKFNNKKQRDVIKNKLTKNHVYPAVLWNIPDEQKDAMELANRLLSIHCDARYTRQDMERLGRIILNNI